MRCPHPSYSSPFCSVRGRWGGLLIPVGPAAWGSRTCHRLITGLTCGGKHAHTLRESPISLRTAGGDPRTHANSSKGGHHLSGKRDLVTVRRSPAGSRVLLIARRLTLVAALCMYECSCVCFWSTCLVLIFLDLPIPHLASANFLSWISSLVCEGVRHLSYFQSCFLLLVSLVAKVAMPFRRRLPACLPISSLKADNKHPKKKRKHHCKSSTSIKKRPALMSFSNIVVFLCLIS